MIISASKSFGGAVALVRVKRGMTQAALAEKLDTNEEEIKGLEEGVLYFSESYPERVANALDVPLNIIALFAVDTSYMSEGERHMVEKLSDFALKLLEREGGCLMPKAICRLENWQYHERNDPQYHRDHVLSGDPYGHPRLVDGYPVTTSEILGKRGSLVETQNTLYDLGKHSGIGPGRAELMVKLEVDPPKSEGDLKDEQS